MYKIVAPTVKLNTANRVPIHFPNIKPANKPMGIPKPSNNTQKIVQIIKIKESNIKLFSRKLRKNSLLVCINL